MMIKNMVKFNVLQILLSFVIMYIYARIIVEEMEFVLEVHVFVWKDMEEKVALLNLNVLK
jgi:hypothetical protein